MNKKIHACAVLNARAKLRKQAKGHLISKANSKFSFEQKKQQKYFCISALASNNPQKVVETKDKSTKRLIM